MNVAVQPQSLAATGEEIPVIDIADFLAGKAGALERCAAELRHAYEDIGFWFVAGHRVPQDLVDRVFAEVARFHAQPMADKLALKIDRHNIGYLAMGAATTRHSTLNRNNKPNRNEAYFVKRDLPAEHPDVVSGKQFRGTNQWPAKLPGFRETIVAYTAAMEALSRSILPIYATALDLPADFFAAPFRDPQFTLRMSHYPHVELLQENEFGLAPHTDTSFMTLLAQNRIPGLALLTASGRWIDAPAIEGAFLVNSGDMLRRWSNDRFRATPHRVVNRSGGDRYAIPFFFDCNVDYVMECLPSCTGPGNPSKYPPTTYLEYMSWYQRQNYDHARTEAAATTAA
jgi:isopenicillin N synthase-like dioxygenase